MAKKVLVAFYSLTGNTKFIAEVISEVLKADLLEIKPVKNLNPEGLSKYFWGGMQTVMSSTPELEDIEIDPECWTGRIP